MGRGQLSGFSDMLGTAGGWGQWARYSGQGTVCGLVLLSKLSKEKLFFNDTMMITFNLHKLLAL